LGYSAQGLAQLRIWWAFGWLLGLLLVLRPTLLKVSRKDLPALVIFGGVGLTGVQLTYYLSIARLNIAVALLVQYLGLVGVTTWEHYRRREAVGGQVWAALALVLVGAFFAVGAYQPALLRVNLPGVVWGLVSAAFFAFYILRASTLARRVNTWTMLVYGFGTGSVLWLAYDAITLSAPPTGWKVWAVMALVGLFGTLIGHALFVIALRTIRPSLAGIVATAEPVFAGLIAWLFLADHLQALQIVGAAVILSGIVMVQLLTRQPVIGAPVMP
jgi:drug/metabolite transporter (DMT)-like permease